MGEGAGRSMKPIMPDEVGSSIVRLAVSSVCPGLLKMHPITSNANRHVDSICIIHITSVF